MKHSTLFILHFTFAFAAFAALQPVVDTDEVFPAAYTEDYKLDGNLDKSVWKTAKVLPQNMYQHGKPLPYKDEIRVLWSKTAIYIGATMWQDLSKASFKCSSILFRI